MLGAPGGFVQDTTRHGYFQFPDTDVLDSECWVQVQSQRALSKCVMRGRGGGWMIPH